MAEYGLGVAAAALAARCRFWQCLDQRAKQFHPNFKLKLMDNQFGGPPPLGLGTQPEPAEQGILT